MNTSCICSCRKDKSLRNHRRRTWQSKHRKEPILDWLRTSDSWWHWMSRSCTCSCRSSTSQNRCRSTPISRGSRRKLCISSWTRSSWCRSLRNLNMSGIGSCRLGMSPGSCCITGTHSSSSICPSSSTERAMNTTCRKSLHSNCRSCRKRGSRSRNPRS